MHNIFRFILFYRITYDPFCSIKLKITTLDRACIKMRCCKTCVFKRKTLSRQPNIIVFSYVAPLHWEGAIYLNV